MVDAAPFARLRSRLYEPRLRRCVPGRSAYWRTSLHWRLDWPASHDRRSTSNLRLDDGQPAHGNAKGTTP